MMSEDLNSSIQLLQSFDAEEETRVEENVNSLFDDMLRRLNVETERELDADKFKGQTKPVLSRFLERASKIMCQQRDMMEKMKQTMEVMKTEALSDKSAIIKLQSDLLDNKNDQLQTLQTTVQSTVQATVQEEIKTYSQAVQSNPSSVAPVFTPDSLKKVVKSAIMEEDRSRNVIVFGLKEEPEENIDQRIDILFSELGEKPKVAASRLGRTGPHCSTSSRPRPVKVSFSSAITVQQIMAKTGKLKKVADFSRVYICPDRSPEEREARKCLVTDLKKAINDKPGLHHFISGGKIQSTAKNVT